MTQSGTITLYTNDPSILETKIDNLTKLILEVSKKVNKMESKMSEKVVIPPTGRTPLNKFLEMFGIPRATYYYKVNSSEYPPAYKDGGRIYIQNKDILEWLQNHESLE